MQASTNENEIRSAILKYPDLSTPTRNASLRRLRATSCSLVAVLCVVAATFLVRALTLSRDCLPETQTASLLVNHSDWVPVIRVAPSCIGAEEGLSHGWSFPGRQDHIYYKYGCWFLVDPDSPVMVNVRHVLSVRSRREAAEVLGSDCTDVYCRLGTGDLLWCEHAIALGYDSIHVEKSHESDRTEIVICYDDCITRRLYETLCVPHMEFHDRANRVCECDKTSEVLACAQNRSLKQPKS